VPWSGVEDADLPDETEPVRQRPQFGYTVALEPEEPRTGNFEGSLRCSGGQQRPLLVPADGRTDGDDVAVSDQVVHGDGDVRGRAEHRLAHRVDAACFRSATVTEHEVVCVEVLSDERLQGVEVAVGDDVSEEVPDVCRAFLSCGFHCVSLRRSRRTRGPRAGTTIIIIYMTI
jgi:hypothetical protein